VKFVLIKLYRSFRSPHRHRASPINVLYQSDNFITFDEPTLTYYHPECIVYIAAHFGVVQSMDYTKVYNDFIHHYDIIWFHCLKNLHCLFPLFLLFTFCRISYGWNCTVCILFILTSLTK
jgi:hypothetical protein